MNSEELSVSSDIKKTSFIEHVFNFNDDTKAHLLNILQYTIICVIPVVLLNKGVAKLIPDVDEDKATYELVAEVLGQSVLTLTGVFFIHRLITYFPTYSGKDYPPFHVTNVAILFVIIASSFQTRVGEKVNILIDRLFDLVEGRSSLKEKSEQKKDTAPHQPVHQPSRADMPQGHHIGTTAIQHDMSRQMPSTGGMGNQQDFNAMFSGPNNPLVGAQQMGSSMPLQEPMAANEMAGSLLNAY